MLAVDDMVVAEEDLEQEEDEGTKLEPFNLEQERQEGRFDESGNYVENKEEDDPTMQDPWLTSDDGEVIFNDLICKYLGLSCLFSPSSLLFSCFLSRGQELLNQIDQFVGFLAGCLEACFLSKFKDAVPDSFAHKTFSPCSFVIEEMTSTGIPL